VLSDEEGHNLSSNLQQHIRLKGFIVGAQRAAPSEEIASKYPIKLIVKGQGLW
jgi:hypothetical protein